MLNMMHIPKQAEPSLSYRIKLLCLVLFSASFGYIETMIVVYLRALYYPDGFCFPLIAVPVKIIVLEVIREFSTIVILISIAVISGRKFWERFGYFLIVFGLWDIFYYIWLKVTLNWPSSLFEWDILFLIPLPWIGPVIAPALVAVEMIVIGIMITLRFSRGGYFRPSVTSWIVAISGTLLLLFSFMRDIDAGLRQQMPQPYWYPLLVVGLVCYGVGYLISYQGSEYSETEDSR